MTSDESDEAWWKEVKGYGWIWPDHSNAGEGTEEKMGKWGPILIDVRIHHFPLRFWFCTKRLFRRL